MPEKGEFPRIPKPSLKSRISEFFRKRVGKKESVAIPEGGDDAKETKRAKHQVKGEERPVENQVEFEQLKAKAIKSLTPREHEVYSLVYEEGLSNAEAARRLGVSDSAIAQRKHMVEVKFRSVFKSNKW